MCPRSARLRLCAKPLPGTTMPTGREAPRSPQLPATCCLAPPETDKCLAVAGDQCGFEAPVTRVVASDRRSVGARLSGARMRAGRGAPRSPQAPGSCWLAPRRKPTSVRELLVGASGMRQVPGSCGRSLRIRGIPDSRRRVGTRRRVDACLPGTRMPAGREAPRSPQVPGSCWPAPPETDKCPAVAGDCGRSVWTRGTRDSCRRVGRPPRWRTRTWCEDAGGPRGTKITAGARDLLSRASGKCPAVAGWRIRRPTGARQLRAIIADSRDPRTAASGATARRR